MLVALTGFMELSKFMTIVASLYLHLLPQLARGDAVLHQVHQTSLSQSECDRSTPIKVKRVAIIGESLREKKLSMC